MCAQLRCACATSTYISICMPFGGAYRATPQYNLKYLNESSRSHLFDFVRFPFTLPSSHRRCTLFIITLIKDNIGWHSIERSQVTLDFFQIKSLLLHNTFRSKILSCLNGTPAHRLSSRRLNKKQVMRSFPPKSNNIFRVLHLIFQFDNFLLRLTIHNMLFLITKV